MGVWLAFSGGKDCLLALEHLYEAGYPVQGLLTTVTLPYARVTMHGVRHWWIQMQAWALNLPLYVMTIPQFADNQTYTQRFRQAVHTLIHRYGADALAFGDIFLEDVRQFRETILNDLPIRLLFPLWGKNTRKLAQHFLARGYRAWIVAVDTEFVPATWLGKPYDHHFLNAINPQQIDPCGERGEFHTFVWDGPLFANPLPLKPLPAQTVAINKPNNKGKIIYVELGTQ